MSKNDVRNMLLFTCGSLFVLSVSHIVYKIAIGEQQNCNYTFGCLGEYFHAIVIKDGGLHSSDILMLVVYLLFSCWLSRIFATLKLKDDMNFRAIMGWGSASMITTLLSFTSFYLTPDNAYIYVGFPIPFAYCSQQYCYEFETVGYRIGALLAIIVDILIFKLLFTKSEYRCHIRK